MATIDTDHQKLTAAGWSYRNNDRGWTIYRDPQTGRWHTTTQAIAIFQSKECPGTAA